MTEIERKALALMNEVREEEGLPPLNETYFDTVDRVALCRAIEEFDAFRQEVSDAVEADVAKQIAHGIEPKFRTNSVRFILPKPVDPLVEAWRMAFPGNHIEDTRDECAKISAAIEKRGGKIVWGEG